jgi:hypothetical protein
MKSFRNKCSLKILLFLLLLNIHSFAQETKSLYCSVITITIIDDSGKLMKSNLTLRIDTNEIPRRKYENQDVYVVTSDYHSRLIIKIDSTPLVIDTIGKHIGSEKIDIRVRFSPHYKCIKVLSNPAIDDIPMFSKSDYDTKCNLVYFWNTLPPRKFTKNGRSYTLYVLKHSKEL